MAVAALPRFLLIREARQDDGGNSDDTRDRAALIAALCAAFALTVAQADEMADAIATARTAAWASAFAEAARAVGVPQADIDAATDPPPQDVQDAIRRVAEASAAAIAATYASDLATAAARIVDEYLSDPAHEGERADSATARAGVANATGQWARDRAAWKSDQVAQTETAQGADEGTAQLVSDLLDGTYDPAAWGVSLDDVVVAVLPEFSSADECADYAGETYSLDDADEVLGLFPMHPFCVHEAVVLVSGGADWDDAQ